MKVGISLLNSKCNSPMRSEDSSPTPVKTEIQPQRSSTKIVFLKNNTKLGIPNIIYFPDFKFLTYFNNSPKLNFFQNERTKVDLFSLLMSQYLNV